ncbi:hypothetical protein [uncultured Sneathiella sp.]|jgi:cation transporter-like permease|uniref:hypothetical protein n=1 Tax=uncultured Sneathiella sp. TaxID=879315 RepID=UPI0030EDF6D0|tara:strand:+ start:643 stop:891 length:249 start_codon:yes stop_codon:yes gene_type:complete
MIKNNDEPKTARNNNFLACGLIGLGGLFIGIILGMVFTYLGFSGLKATLLSMWFVLGLVLMHLGYLLLKSDKAAQARKGTDE